MTEVNKVKANIYIDGFNLYHGICHAKRKDLLWINIVSLVNGFIKPGEEIQSVKYFTATPRVPPPRIRKYVPNVSKIPAKIQRHRLWLKILKSLSFPIKIYEGKFRFAKYECRKCPNITYLPDEKRTDVNIGVQLVRDAYRNDYDVAYIVSGDGDFIPAIMVAKSDFPHLIIHVIFPPRRKNSAFTKIVDSITQLNVTDLEKHILPDPFQLYNGKYVGKPSNWVARMKP
jgi:uncharacterized LabA/DUF88 family protein